MNIEIAKKNLCDINSIAKELELVVFLSHGTCLGAIRENSIFVYDHDTDLAVRAEDFQLYFLDKFRKAGFKCVFQCGILNKTKKTFYTYLTLWRDGEYTDIYLLHLMNGGRVLYYLTGQASSIWPVYLFENPKKIIFLSQKFYVPNPPGDYLKITYGENWKIPNPKQGPTNRRRLKGYTVPLGQRFYEFHSTKQTEELLQKLVNNFNKKNAA